MRGFRHQLVGSHHGQVGQPAEVRLEPPDALVGGLHGVVVGRRILVVDMIAVDGDVVAGLEVPDRRADLEHHPGGVGADDVMVEGMTGPQGALATETVEEAERRQGLEDRGPDRVEVDRTGHHGHVGLEGTELGGGHLVDVDRLAWILVGRGDAVEHVDLVAADIGRPVGLGDAQSGDVLAAGTGVDSVKDVLHAASSMNANVPVGNLAC